MKTSEWSCDSSTGYLYENGQSVGKLITGNNSAWCRLIDQANAANKRAVLAHDAACNCELCYLARAALADQAPTITVAAKSGARFPFADEAAFDAAIEEVSAENKAAAVQVPRLSKLGIPPANVKNCEICGGHHTPPHAWEPRTEK